MVKHKVSFIKTFSHKRNLAIINRVISPYAQIFAFFAALLQLILEKGSHSNYD